MAHTGDAQLVVRVNDENPRNTFAKLASVGLMLYGIRMFAPIIMGDGIPPEALPFIDSEPSVDRIPWLDIGVVASLVPYVLLTLRRMPRRVHIGRRLESVRRPQLVGQTNSLQPARQDTTRGNSGSDRQWEVGVSEVAPVLSLSEARREKLGDTHHRPKGRRNVYRLASRSTSEGTVPDDRGSPWMPDGD